MTHPVGRWLGIQSFQYVVRVETVTMLANKSWANPCLNSLSPNEDVLVSSELSDFISDCLGLDSEFGFEIRDCPLDK